MKRKNYLALVLIIISVFFNVTVVRAEDTTSTTTVEEVTETSTATINCGEITDIPKALPILTSNIVSLIKIAVPILLIIMGMLDMGKAMAASDEKAATESRGKFIRRAIASVIVFLTVTIVQFSLTALNGGVVDNVMLTGLNLFINGTCKVEGAITPYQSCLDRAEIRCDRSCPNEGEGGNSCLTTCMEGEEEDCYAVYESPEVCYVCDHSAAWAVRGKEPSSSDNCFISTIATEEACIKENSILTNKK